MMEYRIMLLDDEPNITEGLCRAFRRLRPGWQIETFESAEQALKRAESSLFDVFISDFRMPSMSGVEFLVHTRQAQPEAVRIILSGQIDVADLADAVNESQIDRFVMKPANPHDLALTVDQTLEHRRVLVENRRLANQVRQQQIELDQQRLLLDSLARQYPDAEALTADGAGAGVADRH